MTPVVVLTIDWADVDQEMLAKYIAGEIKRIERNLQFAQRHVDGLTDEQVRNIGLGALAAAAGDF